MIERAWFGCVEWRGADGDSRRVNVAFRGVHPIDWLAAQGNAPVTLCWFAETSSERVEALRRRTTIAIARP